MRKLTIGSLLAFALITGFGCNSNKSNSENATDATSTDASSSADSGSMTSSDTTASSNMNATPTNQSANDFMLKAASGGMMEVTLGKLAQEKASNADVKAFGQKMVEDHSKANAELKTLAASKNVTLPVELIAEHQKHVDAMSKMSGADFDKHYMTMMVEDHQKDISEFEEASKNEDADVKGFASKTLPVLKMHLEMAQKANAKVSK
ncbi:DUF4142 domain-containing protein [Adhaeribacter radiodurans]|uniref:DUF4142 domain-containing protein n=1 Tax=Adhaeribacter radiodurans TaxID=2745197 RepID=A0A7L7LBG5_9BACT|nr:DUF4142 domain-containing protein [Adhaeribacter radiodurans]QMU30103.1 DUF4142 domain-containing protein [Adhaeribacter radiodurans]